MSAQEGDTPTVGRIVHYFTTNPKRQTNNAGAGPYAAIVTQVVHEKERLVNLYVFPNTSMALPQTLGTVPFKRQEDEQHWWDWPQRV